MYGRGDTVTRIRKIGERLGETDRSVRNEGGKIADVVSMNLSAGMGWKKSPEALKLIQTDITSGLRQDKGILMYYGLK
jgi:hypothetical protein